MDVLLTGKVALENEATIESLKKLGLVHPNVHKSLSFDRNLKPDSTLDLILNNLK